MIQRIKRDSKKNWKYYILFLPVLLYYLVFWYIPQAGLILAFQNFRIGLGVFRSPFIGFDNFIRFFTSLHFGRLVANTFILSGMSLIFIPVAAIILALLLNELHNKKFKKTVQMATYLPFFISIVVVTSLVRIFVDSDGVIGLLVASFTGGRAINLLVNPNYFRAIYLVTDLWRMTGYVSIIYLAAISTIDNDLYEAVRIDGGGRWKQTIHVTLPGLAPTIITIFIMRSGQVLLLGFEKILLLYSPAIYSTSDIISTFVFRTGLIMADYGYATAVGLFNSVVGFTVLLIVNYMAKRNSDHSLF